MGTLWFFSATGLDVLLILGSSHGSLVLKFFLMPLLLPLQKIVPHFFLVEFVPIDSDVFDLSFPIPLLSKLPIHPTSYLSYVLLMASVRGLLSLSLAVLGSDQNSASNCLFLFSVLSLEVIASLLKVLRWVGVRCLPCLNCLSWWVWDEVEWWVAVLG